METFSALLAICAGNSSVSGEFPAQRPVTISFDVFFDLRLNNGWVNSREAGDLRRYRTHFDVTVMQGRVGILSWSNVVCLQVAITRVTMLGHVLNEVAVTHNSVQDRAPVLVDTRSSNELQWLDNHEGVPGQWPQPGGMNNPLRWPPPCGPFY